jgi:hypothetical protein
VLDKPTRNSFHSPAKRPWGWGRLEEVRAMRKVSLVLVLALGLFVLLAMSTGSDFPSCC